MHNCSYAGPLDTDSPDIQLFYWLFKHADPNAPLIVWLQGGPGSTGMIGLFLEVGPLRVTGSAAKDDFVLKAPERAWTDKYNVVFFDQPAGTGFSFSKFIQNGMEDATVSFVEAFRNFLRLYPEF